MKKNSNHGWTQINADKILRKNDGKKVGLR